MGLFDKKYCDVCKAKIGLLGNRKLEDGNLCKNCAKDLSPWFSERRKSTVDQIKQQLSYREENKEAVAEFRVSRTLGMHTKILLDENAGKLIVTSANKWQEENPDVIDFSQITGAMMDVDERKDEIMREGNDGQKESYSPKRYEYRYDFNVIIHVNSPWFDEIKFKVNRSSIEIIPQSGIWMQTGPPEKTPEYRQYESMAQEMVDYLNNIQSKQRESYEAANAPRQAVTCPFCGATTMADASGRCEYCGGALRG